ncbi:MAG: hemagglutinin protein, partial [Flavobacteriales bacterium]|nr:hemagglutinin protein [Flavobacteriales bacterium]
MDWVVVELRDNTNPASIVASRAALIQRDGDVVSTNGTTPVLFDQAPGIYRVALRHRNHLGVMTLNG